ncbi:MAG TPA: DUF373 family protein [archaeon]|nr:DUF373 family protein [archaeon]
MDKVKNVLVVCVDRDDDLGKKAGVTGPVFGRKKNIEAAVKLATKDPGDTDSNSIFGAVKALDELKKLYPNVEIATLTGKGKISFEADKKINEQLDQVLEKFPADGFVLVTDGAEDDQVIPILQSRARIISKEMIIVKQAKQIESTIFTIKEALSDPTLQKLVFGVPGIIVLLYLASPTFGSQLVLGLAGALLMLYGFGIIGRINKLIKFVSGSVSTHRASFPLYLASILVFVFGFFSAYDTYTSLFREQIVFRGIQTIYEIILFTVISSLIFFFGRSVDAILLKKAFRLRNYFRSVVSAVLIWFILDSGRQVFIGAADLNLFLVTIISSFTVLYAAFQFSNMLDIRNKVTRLLIGMPVYSHEGVFLGKIEKINREKQTVDFKLIKTRKLRKLKRAEFFLREGRLLLS